MSVSAASLAASLSELQSSRSTASARPVHGPLSLSEHIEAATAAVRAQLPDTTLTPACRAVLESLLSAADALAELEKRLRAAHGLAAVAAGTPAPIPLPGLREQHQLQWVSERCWEDITPAQYELLTETEATTRIVLVPDGPGQSEQAAPGTGGINFCAADSMV